MDWNSYYQENLNLPGILGNLHAHRDFLNHLISSKPHRILEIGSGSGAMSIFLSWLGFEVVSIDLDPKVIDKAKEENTRWNGRATFEVADTFALPYLDQSFDIIFHQGLLEHFSDSEIRKMLTEQLRVAEKVVFSVPNHNYPRKDFGNERLMTKREWEQILSPFRITLSQDYLMKRFPKW